MRLEPLFDGWWLSAHFLLTLIFCLSSHFPLYTFQFNSISLYTSSLQHALADIGNDGATSTQTEIVILGTTTASLTSTFTQISTKVEVVPSTTLVVLAPTGVVRADNPDGSVYGYIGKTSDYDVMSIHSADAAEVSSVFLVKDPSTGNYEVGFTLQPTLFWVSEVTIVVWASSFWPYTSLMSIQLFALSSLRHF